MKKIFTFVLCLVLGAYLAFGQFAGVRTHEFSLSTFAADGKTDVWDFGAEQLDTTFYNNQLTIDIINAWYPSSIAAGSSGQVLPSSFTAGALSWTGSTNDRLRTTNTGITRYDANIAGTAGFTGRIYVNSPAATGRFLSLTMKEDDEVTLVTRTDAGGKINFLYVADPSAQTDVVTVSDLVSLKFVAKAAGIYRIFDTQGKPSYFRIFRKDATYVTIAGTVNETQADGIPTGYGIVFKNDAGKSWNAVVKNKNFTVRIPAGYSYKLALSGANGFSINSNTTLDVTESFTSCQVTVKKVELYRVTGEIYGLDAKTAILTLDYTPDPASGKIFKPEPQIDPDSRTYYVILEPDCKYTISASGVNDFYLVEDTIRIGHANSTKPVVFALKKQHDVLINTMGLTTEQRSKLGLTFNNLNETGYSYSFNPAKNVKLRNGTYAVAYSGLDDFPVQMKLTSNLTVTSASTSKTLEFVPVTVWSFDDKTITNGTTLYKGLLFTGQIGNEQAKGHLTGKAGATIKVPVKTGDKIKVTYYYSADFSVEGGTAYTTSSGSTNNPEFAEYAYKGTAPGFVTITIGSGVSTTYITEISIGGTVAFKATIFVGTDKEYKTVNDALAAVAKMVRSNNERVTVMIDPGNYEEMLVITVPNVTLKNAAANPGIGLTNKGAGIAPGAVRITSYYGHGYSYYSMGSDQKWNADILKVNRENGYLSYENKGAGTTNGSYWNATVVISANGFEAENIIFENSFNQYISKKESEDVVVMWTSGSKGQRPTDQGNTNVQKRSFVERAAAIAVTNNTDKVVLYNCLVAGRQDSFFGGNNCRVVVYKGAVMGAVDYLFGGMTAVFYKTGLVMNTSDESSDAAYLTAAQQSSGRGYLMYECTVRSANHSTETASTYLSKPGFFGRPWQAATSEVVFYKTTVDTTDFSGFAGKSLITPVGWDKSLGGESKQMYEYGTVEKSGENNLAGRATWATLLSSPVLTDGTPITTFNFTKGNDGWDPIPALVAADNANGLVIPRKESPVHIYANGSRIYLSNVRYDTLVHIYNLNGSLIRSMETGEECNFSFPKGMWIVQVSSKEGMKVVKVVTQ